MQHTHRLFKSYLNHLKHTLYRSGFTSIRSQNTLLHQTNALMRLQSKGSSNGSKHPKWTWKWFNEWADNNPDKVLSVVLDFVFKTLIIGGITAALGLFLKKKYVEWVAIRTIEIAQEQADSQLKMNEIEKITIEIEKLVKYPHNYINEQQARDAAGRIPRVEELVEKIEGDEQLKLYYSSHGIKEYAWLKYILVKDYTTRGDSRESWDKSYNLAKELKKSIELYLQHKYKTNPRVLERIESSSVYGSKVEEDINELYRSLEAYDLLAIYTKIVHSCARTFFQRTGGKERGSLEESKEYFELAIELGRRGKLFEEHLSEANGLLAVKRELLLKDKEEGLIDNNALSKSIEEIISIYENERMRDPNAYMDVEYVKSESSVRIPITNARVQLDCLSQIVRCASVLMDLTEDRKHQDAFDRILLIFFKMNFHSGTNGAIEGVDNRIKSSVLKLLVSVSKKGSEKETTKLRYKDKLQKLLLDMGLNQPQIQSIMSFGSLAQLSERLDVVANSLIDAKQVHRTEFSRDSIKGTTIPDDDAKGSLGVSREASKAPGHEVKVYAFTVEYENHLIGKRETGELFKRAHEIGRVELVNTLIEMGKHKETSEQLLKLMEEQGADRALDLVSSMLSRLEVKKVNDGSQINTDDSVEGTLRLTVSDVKQEEIADQVIKVESEVTADSFYPSFMELMSSISKVPTVLLDAWHWGGKIMSQIQTMVEGTAPELQTDAQSARLAFLFELLDYVRSGGGMPIPYFPHKPDADPDEWGNGGGGGGDKHPRDDFGFGGFGMTADSSYNLTNLTDNITIIGNYNDGTEQ